MGVRVREGCDGERAAPGEGGGLLATLAGPPTEHAKEEAGLLGALSGLERKVEARLGGRLGRVSRGNEALCGMALAERLRLAGRRGRSGIGDHDGCGDVVRYLHVCL